MKGTKERSHLPEGMTLHQRTPPPNQSYDLRLDGAFVGTSEHQENWRGSKFWLFTDIEGTQKYGRVGHHHEDGAAWLKSPYQDGAGPHPAPAGHGAGFETNAKRKKRVEDHAVKQIMACFPDPPYVVRNVGDSRPYDIEVICPDGQVWHIEAKGTRGVCGTVDITEGERGHNQDSCSAQGDVLCVVSEIAADTVGDDFECSEGTLEWVWPWKITEKAGEPGLVPVSYRYTVPSNRYIGPIPPPLAPHPDPGTSTAAT